ncbi:hypothetical protein BamIOP4010DRAFT_2592 [Burkholderia ambifaria IOP40-10]|uniref:Uncharacterized protein n=1 Tax=Burkholderia ambifaria IOP40-10 TaxID=396596 RepID=B1FEY2_9BURK|nr:hypothetical protein BamIOP4010DRAFT_2592 [Burkholderia ambifaria IOP40-10]
MTFAPVIVPPEFSKPVLVSVVSPDASSLPPALSVVPDVVTDNAPETEPMVPPWFVTVCAATVVSCVAAIVPPAFVNAPATSIFAVFADTVPCELSNVPACVFSAPAAVSLPWVLSSACETVSAMSPVDVPIWPARLLSVAAVADSPVAPTSLPPSFDTVRVADNVNASDDDPIWPPALTRSPVWICAPRTAVILPLELSIVSLATMSSLAELTVPPAFVRDCVARSVVSPAADPIVPAALPMLFAVTDRPLPPTIAPD